MSDDRAANTPRDNLYTPSAGSMIVHLQREGGLASRTIVFTRSQVRLLRLLFSRVGLLLAIAFAASWIFFAVQTARVPILTRRLSAMRVDSARLDTLQLRLDELQRRYAQVQGLMSLGKTAPAATVPSHWPLSVPGYITRGSGPSSSGEHNGLDVAVPENTEVLAAGAGTVSEVGESAEYGNFIRLTHSDGYQSFYAHLGKVLVPRNAVVSEKHVIAMSGNTGRSTAPHLHFEITQAGRSVDPLRIIRRGQNGNLR
jgi:murein DD-endopeptidase MepM/ murein hydrolase activator NlpD